MLNDDIDDSNTKIEPESLKENPEVNDDDDVNIIEKIDDEKKHDNVEKTDDVAEKDNDDHIDLALVRETLDKINDLAPEITVAKTNKKFKEAIPRLIDQAVIRDKEINSTNVADLISKEFATQAHGITADLF
nr:hypothetical protein [Tanacetum cinerariifolium]